MTVSIKTIAEKAGVSGATVSLALRNHPRISKKRCKEIQHLAEKLNYVPSNLARGLVKGKTNTIGFLVGPLQLEIAQKKVVAMDEIANCAGYKLLLSYTKGEIERTVASARELQSHGVDGIIFYGLSQVSNKHDQSIIFNSPTPKVFLDPKEKLPFIYNQVSQDKESGMKEAVENLFGMGHREIYMLRGHWDGWWQDARFKGFLSALDKCGIDSAEDRIVKVCDNGMIDREGAWVYDADQIVTGTETFIGSHPECTAIFCSSDIVAISILSVLLKMGIKVPEQISIVGFDNITITKHLHPRLSTISQPVDKLVNATFDLLMNTIENKNHEPRHMVIPTEFVPRESIGPVREQ